MRIIRLETLCLSRVHEPERQLCVIHGRSSGPSWRTSRPSRMDRFVRISYGLPHEHLVPALDRIHELIVELKG